jgi:hypothetical protein
MALSFLAFESSLPPSSPVLPNERNLTWSVDFLVVSRKIAYLAFVVMLNKGVQRQGK